MPLVSLLINWMHPCAIEVLFLVSFLTRAAGGSSAVLPVPFGPHGLDVVHWRCAAHAVEALAHAAVGQAAVGHGGVRIEPLRSGRGVTQGQRSGVRRGWRRGRGVAAQEVALVFGAAVRMEWLRWSDGAARVQGGTAARPEPGIPWLCGRELLGKHVPPRPASDPPAEKIYCYSWSSGAADVNGCHELDL